MSTWCKWCGRNQYCRKCAFVDEPSPTIALEVVVHRGDRPYTAKATIAWLEANGWVVSEVTSDSCALSSGKNIPARTVMTKRVIDRYLNS